MGEVRVRSSMTCALEEAEVRGVVDGAGEFADRFGQSSGEIGNTDAPRDFRFWQAAHMEDRFFVFDLLPLETDVAGGHVEALAILASAVEQLPGHLGADVAPLDLERSTLNREGRVVFLDVLIANAP
jgi:hypothetical protein